VTCSGPSHLSPQRLRGSRCGLAAVAPAETLPNVDSWALRQSGPGPAARQRLESRWVCHFGHNHDGGAYDGQAPPGLGRACDRM